MNIRKSIRSEITKILTAKTGDTYPTSAADRVYNSPFLPIPDNDLETNLPAICIYCGPEDIEQLDNLADRRTQTITIECISCGDSVDDDLDDLSGQVENLLLAKRTLNDLVDHIKHKSSEPGYDRESHSNIQSMKLTYDVIYQTDAFYTPAGSLDDFITADAKTQDSEDTVTLPQEA